jgi:hypothetical protein
MQLKYINMTNHQHQLILKVLSMSDLDFFEIIDMTDDELEEYLNKQ